MRVAWPRATSPMPRTLPPRSWIGRTVASRTSTTRLDFSCMTPMRIQVLYCVSMKNRSTSPITDVAFVVSLEPGWRVWTGTGLAWSTCAAWAGVSPAAS